MEKKRDQKKASKKWEKPTINVMKLSETRKDLQTGEEAHQSAS